jgi:hypothetical protein
MWLEKKKTSHPQRLGSPTSRPRRMDRLLARVAYSREREASRRDLAGR